MRQNFLAGGFGYGHAKQALYGLISKMYAKEREQINYYMINLDEVNRKLQKVPKNQKQSPS